MTNEENNFQLPTNVKQVFPTAAEFIWKIMLALT
mgnify:CR=1 FL=1